MAIKEHVITPDYATQLLGRNENNRRLSIRRATALAAKMKEGEWQYNGDTIRISKTGRLLDGQHRLMAIELSGIAQKQIIVDDLEDEVFTTIDIGSARKPSQMVEMTGLKNPTALAAASKLHLMYQSTGRPIHGNPDKAPSPTSIVNFAQDCVEMQESVNYCAARKWLVKYVTASAASFCHFEFGQVDADARDKFFNELESGEFSYHDSPIKIVRDQLIEDKGGTHTPDRMRRLGLMFKAFRMFVEAKPAKMLRLAKDPEEWFGL